MKAPLEGIRVVELASYVAVPAAGALLADLGAEVIKVETPPHGEVYRFAVPKYAGYDSDFLESPPFQMDNAGKRSIALNIKQPEARKALLRIIDRADVFITNLVPPRRHKYGVDHETLLARSPHLIMGAISGYGLGGPDTDKPAFDYTAYWARTGMMDLMHDEGTPPSLQRPGIGDHAAAVNLVCGILAALRLRDTDGKGKYVDVSLLQTGLHVLGNDLSTALVTRQPVPRHDRRVPANPLWNSYPTKDGRWLLLVMINPDRYWPRLCGAIGRSDLVSDPRFVDGFARSTNSAELVNELNAVFKKETLSKWETILNRAELIWAPVRRIDEAIADPHSRAMGYFLDVAHEAAGHFETVGPPFRIRGFERRERAPAPQLNADAKDILREAGMDESEIKKLL